MQKINKYLSVCYVRVSVQIIAIVAEFAQYIKAYRNSSTAQQSGAQHEFYSCAIVQNRHIPTTHQHNAAGYTSPLAVVGIVNECCATALWHSKHGANICLSSVNIVFLTMQVRILFSVLLSYSIQTYRKCYVSDDRQTLKNV